MYLCNKRLMPLRRGGYFLKELDSVNDLLKVLKSVKMVPVFLLLSCSHSCWTAFHSSPFQQMHTSPAFGTANQPETPQGISLFC